MNDNPLVSVIIPTFNSEKLLEKCLRSVKEQCYGNVEVIVVDNSSRDRTREIAEKYADLILLKGPERSVQVNFGVKHARGKYVYRVDSDFVVEPSVVEEAVEKCETGGYDAVAIHNTSDPTVSFWSRVRKLERDCYRDDEFNIGARFLRKEVFEAVGGFDEALIAAEDYDLHNKLLKKGFKVGRIRAQEIHVGEPKTLAEIARKHYYYGKTIQNYIRKNPERAKKQWSPVRLGYFKHISQFMEDPILAAGLIVYQSVRYFATITGVLAIKLGGEG